MQGQLPQQCSTSSAEESSVTMLERSTSNPVVTNSTTEHNTTTNYSEWHISFTIPDLRSFSHHVKEAVTTGVITARARKEINQILRTYITAYTTQPSSEQYTTVCRKLVEKYPNLKDTKGKTKYVSIKQFSLYITSIAVCAEFTEVRTTYQFQKF